VKNLLTGEESTSPRGPVYRPQLVWQTFLERAARTGVAQSRVPSSGKLLLGSASAKLEGAYQDKQAISRSTQADGASSIVAWPATRSRSTPVPPQVPLIPESPVVSAPKKIPVTRHHFAEQPIARLPSRRELVRAAVADLESKPGQLDYTRLALEAEALESGKRIDQKKYEAVSKKYHQVLDGIEGELSTHEAVDPAKTMRLAVDLLRERFLAAYQANDAGVYSALSGEGGADAVGQTLIVLGSLRKLELPLPPGYELGVQVFADFIRPVLYARDGHEVIDLVFDRVESGVTAPIYSDKVVAQAFLRDQRWLLRRKSPTNEKELLRIGARPGIGNESYLPHREQLGHEHRVFEWPASKNKRALDPLPWTGRLARDGNGDPHSGEVRLVEVSKDSAPALRARAKGGGGILGMIRAWRAAGASGPSLSSLFSALKALRAQGKSFSELLDLAKNMNVGPTALKELSEQFKDPVLASQLDQALKNVSDEDISAIEKLSPAQVDAAMVMAPSVAGALGNVVTSSSSKTGTTPGAPAVARGHSANGLPADKARFAAHMARDSLEGMGIQSFCGERLLSTLAGAREECQAVLGELRDQILRMDAHDEKEYLKNACVRVRDRMIAGYPRADRYFKGQSTEFPEDEALTLLKPLKCRPPGVLDIKQLDTVTHAGLHHLKFENFEQLIERNASDALARNCNNCAYASEGSSCRAAKYYFKRSIADYCQAYVQDVIGMAFGKGGYADDRARDTCIQDGSTPLIFGIPACTEGWAEKDIYWRHDSVYEFEKALKVADPPLKLLNSDLNAFTKRLIDDLRKSDSKRVIEAVTSALRKEFQESVKPLLVRKMAQLERAFKGEASDFEKIQAEMDQIVRRCTKLIEHPETPVGEICTVDSKLAAPLDQLTATMQAKVEKDPEGALAIQMKWSGTTLNPLYRGLALSPSGAKPSQAITRLAELLADGRRVRVGDPRPIYKDVVEVREQPTVSPPARPAVAPGIEKPAGAPAAKISGYVTVRIDPGMFAASTAPTPGVGSAPTQGQGPADSAMQEQNAPKTDRTLYLKPETMAAALLNAFALQRDGSGLAKKLAARWSPQLTSALSRDPAIIQGRADLIAAYFVLSKKSPCDSGSEFMAAVLSPMNGKTAEERSEFTASVESNFDRLTGYQGEPTSSDRACIEAKFLDGTGSVSAVPAPTSLPPAK
jgi:hypothetical protein